MQKVSQINFTGKFRYDKLKPKQTKKLNEILTAKHNGISNEQYLKDMPFDIDVVSLNPTKRAIHPRFNVWANYRKKDAAIQGCIKLNSKNPVEENVKKLRGFISNVYEKAKSLKGDEKLTSAEETQRQVDFLLFGRY